MVDMFRHRMVQGKNNYYMDTTERRPSLIYEIHHTKQLLCIRINFGKVKSIRDSTWPSVSEKYNSMDEIAPYSENTSALFNNDYHGKVKSAFAKIPITSKAFNQVFDSRNS